VPNLTSAQVAKLTGVSVRTVHRMIRSGKLRYAQKFPGDTGGYLFRPSDVRRAFPDVVIPEAHPEAEHVA
jgi:excisionase family DNA binding protein